MMARSPNTSSKKKKHREYSPTVRKGKKKGNNKKRKSSSSAAPNKAVDLVTGKTTVEYFFDPSLLINGTTGSETPFKTAKDGQDPNFFQSKHLFLPCTIIKPINDENSKQNKKISGQPFEGPTLVKTADGTLHKIRDSTLLVPLSVPDDYVGMEDVLHLKEITEASLLHTLRLRYKKDDIYTLAGPILIAINPYQTIVLEGGESLYSENRMMMYRGQTKASQTPHLFQIADRAYTALMDSVHVTSNDSDEDPVLMTEYLHMPGTVRNQSIIISGESGAGKTESTKIIMKYLARITRKTESTSQRKQPAGLLSPDGKMIAALEDRVLSSNPLLETFGNAQTLRNDNSSRFGKFINIYFDLKKGGITGASISNYLLEKTRVTTQVEGERNYHVFYQLLQDKELCEEFDLGTDAKFSYLNPSSESSEHDAATLSETKMCLDRIGLSSSEQSALFGMVAAVLHLGNITFEAPDEHSDATISGSSDQSLKKVCELLGLDEERLSHALLTKVLVINGKTIQKPQNVVLAQDKRDALAKMTYSCMFLWLVGRINDTLQATSNTSASDGFIGVLDIYGFECFEQNGLEQLLINYCNEKLQRHFNRHLFEVEQELYANEGVDWSYITFNDNRPCLELIEGSGVGIINTLDDAWGGLGSSTEKDGKFVSLLHKQFGTSVGNQTNTNDGHPNFVTPKFGNDTQFSIVHYAGEVRYTVDGFVEKNMETMSNEIRDLGEKSTIDIAKRVYMDGQISNDTSKDPMRSSIRGTSVSSQFRSSLQTLVGDLDRTQPHYIRCVKPNLNKAPGLFQAGEILKQLRYSGMMEAIRIRREGYALREQHESFYARFSVLLTQEEKDREGSGIEQLVEALSDRLNVTDADWQIGHSKIFLRRDLSDKLERLAKLRVHVAARTIGRFGRHVSTTRVSKLLVAWVRFRLVILKKNRRNRASTVLAARYRGHRQQLAFHNAIRAIVLLQSHGRCLAAKKHARLLKDPYCDMDFRQIKGLLKTERSRLDDAVASNNFQLAAQLEPKVAELEGAMNKKRPLTRKNVDDSIADLQRKLDDAVARKAYTECGAFQDELDSLKQKQLELPTVDEIRIELKEAEAAVAEAAKKRDFAGAAGAQEQLANVKSKLADVLAAQDEESDEPESSEDSESHLAFDSRAQLEYDLSEIRNQVKSSIDEKDFKKASLLQQALDEREKFLKFFPSVAELKADLDDLKEKMTEALTNKAFARAEKLDASVVELEKKIKYEQDKMKELGVQETSESKISAKLRDGSEKSFTSRADLDGELKEVTRLVSLAVQNKEFKKADSIQADVDVLMKLRERLPSIAELKQRISDKKRAMDSAIAAKKFGEADEINSMISQLEAKLDHEKSLLPTRSVPPSPAPVTSRVGISQARPPVARVGGAQAAWQTPKRQASKGSNGKPVSKLRPAKPAVSHPSASVLYVTQYLAKKRGNAVVIIGDDGSLEGIVTDTDITRRVVAKGLDPGATSISEVMTPNPTCVATTDPAMDALATMVENHFRHLPVVDTEGSVAGVLDIAKCLNDAISKLEKVERKGNSAAQDAVKQLVSQQGGNDSQALAMQALLGNLLSQSFGGKTSPTLRSLLAGRPSTVVESSTSIRDAGVLMAENRKASLVVENGKLVGIFGFKDMMTRAVAKNIDLDLSAVTEVMTPEPEFVSPSMTVLEALQTMHDNKFLTLPVCEEDGAVVGIVDVMDVIYGCGGAEGWRSVFSSAWDIEDDITENDSVNSVSKSTVLAGRQDRSIMHCVRESADERPVSKLRPSKPIVSRCDDSVLRASQVLAAKRGAATLVVGQDGSLSGILTDTDITRRLVAQNLESETTTVETVMTPNPTCVSLTDSAMDALTTMVENHFRHLPVVDDGGSVVGLLDIAKCLNDAIGKLEKSQRKPMDTAASGALKSIISEPAARDVQTIALQQLLGSLMSKAFGNGSSPTLRSLLKGRDSPMVNPDTSIREAGISMAVKRKAALIVEDGKLVGIFGFKDMMTRVVAKGRNMDMESVSSVMTEDPESVSPETTVLEALQIMHDSGFLNLPVCENDGSIVGLVGVMDLINGCGGADGWRCMFSSLQDADDHSDTASVISRESFRSQKSATKNRPKTTEKSVAKLRPAKPHLSNSSDSILAVTQFLQRKRGDASVIVDENGCLSGIVTDTDITRRAVAKYVDVTSSISLVMTPNPTCVLDTDSAMDALTTMVDNHFRHLPVTDLSGNVVGVLDIAKCLNDAISKLERSHEKSSSAAEDTVKQLVTQQGAKGEHADAMKALLGGLLSQAFGNSSIPTLRSLLAGKPSTVVEPSTSVRAAGQLMAENRKAALIVEDGNLVGIFGFKDMMSRAVAKQLDLDVTSVSVVMTPDPEFVSPDMTVLEALQTMHDNKFLTLPVCEDNGTVVGLVDVMDVIHGCGGVQGWKAVFTNALELDDFSESKSLLNSVQVSQIKAPPETPYVNKLPTNIPSTLEFDHAAENASLVGSTIGDERGVSKLMSPDDISGYASSVGVFKISAPDGSTHRVRCATRFDELFTSVTEKISIPKQNFQLEYTDDEGDTVIVSSDDDVVEAWSFARKAGHKVAKLNVVPIQGSKTALFAGAAGVSIALIGALAFILTKPKKA